MDAGNFESEDDEDEAVFLVQRASEAITAWKAHHLRSINQDRARLEVLASLDSTGVLIVQDFAMKFMPVQYREAQSDFFGKRGLSWHVSVCHRKVGGKLESQTFIHILQTGLQDSTAVVLIMDHVLRSLKKQHPEIVRCFSGKTMPNATIQHKPYCQWISCQKGVESRSMMWILVIRRAEKAHAIERRPK